MELHADIQNITITDKDGSSFRILATIDNYFIIGTHGKMFRVSEDFIDDFLEGSGETLENIRTHMRKKTDYLIENDEIINDVPTLITYLRDEDNE